MEAEVLGSVRRDNDRALVKLREGGMQIVEFPKALAETLEKKAEGIGQDIARDVAIEYGKKVRGIVEEVRARNRQGAK